MLVKIPQKHSAWFGTTQTGKTFAATKSLGAVSEGVLFLNVNHAPVKGYINADKFSDSDALFESLKKGGKINYEPSRETRWQELSVLIEMLLERPFNVYIIVDECHLMSLNPDKHKRAAQAACEELVTTGLSKGLKGAFITQRPALMPNTLMTQSEFKIFFRTENEGPYLKNYGIPHEDMMQRLDQGGEYAYTTYYRGVLEGPYKV